ncbi:unnamed protein product [Mortierella alpina]
MAPLFSFFNAHGVFRHSVKTNDWESSQNATLITGFHAGATADTDTGLVYSFKSTLTLHRCPRVPPLSSSAAKGLYLYEAASDNASLFKYDIASKAWNLVNVTGDIPAARSSPCFASAYGGKKLILAGGITERSADEVYVFDVTTAVWTRTSSIPIGYYGGTCAVSGDSFILWGGAYRLALHEGGPIVLDMPSVKWGTKFTPGPASANPVIPAAMPSAADRGSRALPIALSLLFMATSILCIF